MAPPDIDFMEEIKARIEAAMVEDGPLASIKRVKIGAGEEARGGDSSAFPLINIDLIDGSNGPESQNNQRFEIMNVSVTLVVSKLASDENKLYDTADSSGALFLFGKLRNVIEKNTAGVIDNGFNGTVQNFLSMNYKILQDQACVECQLNLSAQSKQFIAGGR